VKQSGTQVVIGMNARLFPNNWRPVREEIGFARQWGFGALQVHGREGGVGVEQLGDEPEVVGGLLREAGLVAVMEIVMRVREDGRTASGVGLVEMLRANLAAIGGLGCVHVHFHLVQAVAMDAAMLREVEARVVPEFAAGVALAQEHGFRLGVEHNEPSIGLLATPEDCGVLLEQVSGLGFVWDLNHSPQEQLAGYLGLAPRMSMLHVADTPLPEVNWHLPLGKGSVDFGRYCEALHNRGFAGPAILEIGGLPISGGYGRDTDEALIESRERFEKALRNAQEREL
jgi:L-ribulose-5-phosphate 3-epimerase